VQLGKNNRKTGALLGNSTERNALYKHNRHYRKGPDALAKKGSKQFILGKK